MGLYSHPSGVIWCTRKGGWFFVLSFGVLTLLIGWQKGIRVVKNSHHLPNNCLSEQAVEENQVETRQLWISDFAHAVQSHHPFAVDRPPRLRPKIFRILLALAWHNEWSLLLHDIIGDWMIPFAANAAAKSANAFEWPGQPPKIAHSIEDLHPIQYMVPWAHQSFSPKTASGSVQPFCTAYHRVSYYCTMGLYISPNYCPFTLGDRVPILTNGT